MTGDTLITPPPPEAEKLQSMTMPQHELEEKYEELRVKYEKLRSDYLALWEKAQSAAHELKSHFICHKEPQ